MNPLEKIKDWLLKLEPELKKELIFNAKFFHPDEEIRQSFDNVEVFFEYLESQKLDTREIVARTLIVTQLINYALDGKDTNSHWNEAIDKNLELRNRIDYEKDSTEKMKSRLKETLDKVISGIPARKEVWKGVCESWNNLFLTDLTYKEVTHWYFTEDFNKK